MSSIPARAYTDRLSYERGERLSVHVNSNGPVEVRLVRLLSSTATDTTLDTDVEWAAAGTYPATSRETCVGSFLQGETGASGTASAFTFGAFVWSGNFASTAVQTVIAIADGLSLQLHDGRLALVDSDEKILVATDQPLINHQWHFVVVLVDDSSARVAAMPVDGLRGARCDASTPIGVGAFDLSGPITVAARGGREVATVDSGTCGIAVDHFNGKVERPFVARGVLSDEDLRAITHGERDVTDLDLVAGWDLAFTFGEDPATARALAPGQPDGRLVNGPARGVTGRLFSGRSLDFNLVPTEYAAAHFHATDLVDARWDSVLNAALPDDLVSGVYGVVVTSEAGQDVVPITVVPRSDDRRQRVAVVLPTFTYLAYANESLFNGLDTSAMTDKQVVVSAEDLAHLGDPSFGLSMYDHHPDGSGVMLSSARRQIVNMRRDYNFWIFGAGRAFSSDMYLVEWLARRGIDVDVITDHEVHLRGAAYLAPYAAVISGSHPEYTSGEMLDALTTYRDAGGGLLYLGGNGWYWVTGVLSGDPLVVEIRRGQSGVRCWESLPGEVTLMSTGEPGGLWRHRGRPPQALAGVGFAAQGWGRSEPYYLAEAATAERFAWIMEGVDEDPIGAYGEVMGGAAGDEIDRADTALGTPHHATIIASSRGHSNYYQRVVEEIAMNLPDHGGGEQDPEVHADIVYFQTPGGGEVFSTGSIAWSGALLHRDGDNGVSRMTENVIRAFVARRSR